jgi:hypothetical protein
MSGALLGVLSLRARASVCALLLSLLSACSSTEEKKTGFLPHIGGNPEALEAVSADEMRQLQLVSTNLVSVLMQLPEMQPATVTLQVSRPVSAFGNTLIRALEDAGYGLQRVSADQGQNYTTYSKRHSETEAGPISDFELSVGNISIGREYIVNNRGIFPSSLVHVEGTENLANIQLNDDIFREQGGSGDSFISGLRSDDSSVEVPAVEEVVVNDFDEMPAARRTSQLRVLATERQRNFKTTAQRKPVDLSGYQRMRRTVLIFNDNSTRMMGPGNKQAIRLLVREYRDDDVFVVTACTDADGHNEAADSRGIRVEEEFISHGIPVESVYLAPCMRASFRHPTDNSPVPVEVVQHRRQ